MKAFIYLFGFFTLAISPVTCALEQQQQKEEQQTTSNTNTIVVPPSTLDGTTPSANEIDPPNQNPTKP